MAKQQQTDVRDMAIIHRTFRSTFSESAALVRANPTPSPGRVTFLADHIDFAIAMLHHHHEGEDELLYPLLVERVPDEAVMVETVEAQHKEVTGSINAATDACKAWRATPSTATGEALGARLVELNDVLQPHLDDEEQKIVPLSATTVTQKEWDALGDHGMAATPKKMLPIAFGLITEPLDEDDSRYMKGHLPLPVRLLYPVLIGRPWKKYADTLRNGT